MFSRSTLLVATCSLGLLALAAVMWMFFASLTPTASIEDTHRIEIDVSTLKPGEVRKVEGEGSDLFILHRTPEQIAWLRSYQPPRLAAQREDGIPSPDFANLHRSLSPEFLVVAVWKDARYWRLMVSRSTASVCDDFRYTPQPIRVAPDTTFPGGFYCASMHRDLSGVVKDASFIYDPAGRSYSPDIQPLTVPNYSMKDRTFMVEPLR